MGVAPKQIERNQGVPPHPPRCVAGLWVAEMNELLYLCCKSSPRRQISCNITVGRRTSDRDKLYFLLLLFYILLHIPRVPPHNSSRSPNESPLQRCSSGARLHFLKTHPAAVVLAFFFLQFLRVRDPQETRCHNRQGETIDVDRCR